MGREDDARTAWRLVAELFMGPENHNRFHAACDAIGLPHPGALKLLLGIEADDPPAMRDIAVLMNCDASWVTALVDALEAPGYVRREVSPVDRRVKRVQLTPAGTAAKEQAMEVLATPPKVMDRLSESETRQLAKILTKLV